MTLEFDWLLDAQEKREHINMSQKIESSCTTGK